MTRITAIRPGILVALKTKIEGGRTYKTTEEEKERDGVTETANWSTTRVITDAEEWQRAEEVRKECRKLVVNSCIPTDFGLICSTAKEQELLAAIDEARNLASEFNESARHSTIKVLVIPARIAENDSEAARAILSQVADLVAEMEKGVEKADPAAIREAANSARKLGSMLDESNQKRVNDTIEAARKAARDIVRRVQKGGELASTVVAELTGEKSAISAARIAFLDLEAQVSQARGQELPAVEVGRFAELAGELPQVVKLDEVAAAVPRVVELVEEKPAEAPAAPKAERDIEL